MMNCFLSRIVFASFGTKAGVLNEDVNVSCMVCKHPAITFLICNQASDISNIHKKAAKNCSQRSRMSKRILAKYKILKPLICTCTTEHSICLWTVVFKLRRMIIPFCTTTSATVIRGVKRKHIFQNQCYVLFLEKRVQIQSI